MTVRRPAHGRGLARSGFLGGLVGLAIGLLAVFAGGCADTRGPELVVNSHLDYNKAVSQVLREELLLNVVRRRSMGAPQVLDVASIS